MRKLDRWLVKTFFKLAVEVFVHVTQWLKQDVSQTVVLWRWIWFLLLAGIGLQALDQAISLLRILLG